MAFTRTSDQSIRIGFQVPSDDVTAVTGYCAALLAIEEANASGPLPGHVELVPIVDRRDRDVARRAATAFVTDPNAVGVLGPLNSDMAIATQDIYAAAGLAQLTSEASSPLLTSKGYANFFRLVANDEHQGRSLAQVAVRLLKAQRIVVLHDGSGWGRPIAEIFSAEAARLGSSPVLVRGFGEPEARLDFDELAVATADAEPDLVYFAVYWNKAHLIAHKLRYRGSRAVFLGSDALKPFAFLERFAARFPVLLASPQYAGEAYDCASLLIEAIRRAGKVDRSAVLSALRAIDGYEGAIGRIAFDEAGDVVDPEISLYRCQDGQRRYVGAIRDLVG